MRTYKCLSQQEFFYGEYRLVPIRHEDRYEIMKWRNEQIYHLRQKEPLNTDQQDAYFQNVVAKLYDQEQPNQILFSFLKNGQLIGYGGLVHINWVDKNAEVSFVMDSKLEDISFVDIWEAYLILIKRLSFKTLNFHKIYTYAFDLRPRLYTALETHGFKEEGRLKNHLCINNEFKDVLIHGLLNPLHNLSYRKAISSDVQLLFKWANDSDVRDNAFNSEKISFADHNLWLKATLQRHDCEILIFKNIQNVEIGQVRIELKHDFWFIDYSVDKSFRGLGVGSLMIQQIVQNYTFYKFKAQVKTNNKVSRRVFERINFKSHEIKPGIIEYLLDR